MSVLSASILNNFADMALALPLQTLEVTVKQNPSLVDSTGYDGRTPLQKAVWVGNVQVAKVLLQYGADPNLRDPSGVTAVHLACARGALESLVLLLKHGGDPTIGDGTGRIAVHCACQAGSVVMVQYLAEVCEVSLEASDRKGATCLHIAAACGHLDLVEYLVHQKKVSKEVVDCEGNTPLHCASLSGMSGVCWNIINPGTEYLLTIANMAGLTPTQLALTSNAVSPDCQRWLDQWMKQYQHSGYVESPFWPWVIQLLIPPGIFHLSILLSIVAVPNQQYLVSAPAFVFLLVVMTRQGHRMKHPSRWPNPIYLSAYLTGVFSTVLCYLFWMNAVYSAPVAVTLLSPILLVHCLLILKLLRGDPGKVKSEGPLQEVLRGVGEGVVRGYCSYCQVASPPLSHHCRLCSTCHYQSDHHCLFLNRCIARNNHWHFVIFILTNIVLFINFICAGVTIVPAHVSKAGMFAERLSAYIVFLLHESCWTLFVVICNATSLMWGLYLLRYQYGVISTQQTTLCRLKLGAPTRLPLRTKLKNFIYFLLHRKVLVSNPTHYFQQQV